MDLQQDLKYLFCQWLEEEYNVKVQRGQRNAPTFYRALKSVRQCPYPIKHPNQLSDLKFIGDKLVKLMSNKLQEYCDENGYNFPVDEASSAKEKANQDAEIVNNGRKRKSAKKSDKDPTKKKRKRKYVPAKNTGGYAILLVLYVHDLERKGMTKAEIIRHAVPFCSSSFTSNPSTGQFYSAWNSVNTLIKNEYVLSRGRPVYYYLTEEGEEVAGILKKVDDESKQRTSLNSPHTDKSLNSSFDRSPQYATKDNYSYMNRNIQPSPTRSDIARSKFSSGNKCKYNGVDYDIWPSGSYEIFFVSDDREVRSREEPEFFAKGVRARGVNCKVRALSVGDGVWVAINKESGSWATLDFIFERKRLDDLAESIKDGRFREQKSRLDKTGLQRIMYIIEEQMSSDISRFSDAIQTSMSMAVTYSNFHLKRTKDSDDTVKLLAMIHKQVQSFYKGKSLVVLEPRNLKSQKQYKSVLEMFRGHFTSENSNMQVVYNFDTFQGVMSKSSMTTVAEMFVRLLMTTRGVSLDKAIEIQREFKTPKKLIEKYQETGISGNGLEDQQAIIKDKEMLIHNIFKDRIGVRKIGPALSKKLYEVWGK
ncbi:hypothetical protein BRETT_000964 [Brettanomyces bruxellensis]|uniref:Crossover junction endonuclease MUS81 n=1 Tax=Dekkera bruxellensis TaxID=5007 RepID=A0A871R3X6_DEKBR|nr:uncharacterized protein BRETT_000964 [Brettanomyces bruxellensis]QOU21243.1 hypothetical protein BRETT_000964 [Brettanomyces bruxellensis]